MENQKLVEKLSGYISNLYLEKLETEDYGEFKPLSDALCNHTQFPKILA